MNIHHIGYYVPDIEDACNNFQVLGYVKENSCIYDAERRIYIQFLRNNNLLVELVSPAENCELFSRKMRKMGPSPYHICYECTDIEKAINEYVEKGFFLMHSPSPAIALGNNLVAFLYSDSVGMVELVEI